jgi:alanyl-tRNA synthetase
MDNFTYSDKNDEAMIESANKDEKGPFIVLNQTIFYPQGGGQPSDQGQVCFKDRSIPVLSVRRIDGEIRHYTDQEYSQWIGEQVRCQVDLIKRKLHSRLHTAGHLISHVVEKMYPACKAIKGHHFPGECYVEFLAKERVAIDSESIKRKMNEVIQQRQNVDSLFVTEAQFRELCPDLAYEVSKNRGQAIRLIKIGDFAYQPCGGTHVKETSELLGLDILKIKAKDRSLKIYYTLAGS